VIETKQYNKTILSIVQQCKKGQPVCGDAYFTEETEDYLIMAIADGLGSGSHAKEAATQATRCFQDNHHLDVKELILLCNQHLHHTRGAVVGVMKLDFDSSTISYAGIGNIQFMLYPEHQKAVRTISKPGYLNGRPIQVFQQQVPYLKGTPFIMFSDGLDVKRTIQQNVNIQENPDSLIHQIAKELDGINDDLTFIVGNANHY
jgi:negative regulator of sigma-B (phosphoserine phosphatase)